MDHCHLHRVVKQGQSRGSAATTRFYTDSTRFSNNCADRLIGAASYRQQNTMASCYRPPPPPRVLTWYPGGCAGVEGSKFVLCTASLPMGGGQRYSFCALSHYLGAVGSGNLIVHCPFAGGQWAVEISLCTVPLVPGWLCGVRGVKIEQFDGFTRGKASIVLRWGMPCT